MHTASERLSASRSEPETFPTFVLLKKALVFIFIFAYLFSSTECSQLLKLPALFGHFEEHKKRDGNTTLWSFLCMHYSDSNTTDADEAKDRELPFKNHSDCQGTIKEITFQNLSFTLKPLCIEHRVLHSSCTNSFSASFLSCIWQPPKSC